VTGKDPNSVASAAIYMAAKLAADDNDLT